MNETRRKPTTTTQCPTLFTGSFICPVAQTRLDMPRPLITQTWTTGAKVKVLWHKADLNLLVHSQTRQPPDHDDRPKSEDQLYPGSSRGDLLPIREIVCENSPATCCPPPWVIPIKQILALHCIALKNWQNKISRCR